MSTEFVVNAVSFEGSDVKFVPVKKVVKVAKVAKTVKAAKTLKVSLDNPEVTTTQVTNSIITKPLLAETLKDVEKLFYPCLVTPKLDGIRALRIGTDLVSRQFKPIRNKTIRDTLAQLLPEGSDGEIMVGETFQDVSSKVMSISGGIDFKEPFTYYWFDYVKDDANKSYVARMQDMKDYVNNHPDIMNHPQAKIIPLYPKEIHNSVELQSYEVEVLAENYEGVMIRKADGKYKMGRSSLREGILLKLKRFDDAEATIVAVQELFHNENEKTKNEVGNSKRSTKKEGLIPAGKLGSLEVINDAGERFNIGSGFTDAMKVELWKDSPSLIGKIVKYKYFKVGSKNAPRFPTFLGFRDKDDM